jgi:hypothetical protein
MTFGTSLQLRSQNSKASEKTFLVRRLNKGKNEGSNDHKYETVVDVGLSPTSSVPVTEDRNPASAAVITDNP